VKTEIRIRENSLLARAAAFKLRADSMAITLGGTIHLHNADREEFLNNEQWLRHEMAHVRQFRRYGFLRFITLYLLESLRKGYQNNRFEVEARAAEKQVADLNSEPL
jgi:hypothetical protein